MNGDEAYAYAWEHADRDADGHIIEESLVALVAESVDFDPLKERIGKAQRIVARRKRPGQTAPAGALVLPGLEPYSYEPDRLLVDAAGNLVPNRFARAEDKKAAATRSEAAADKALARRDRERLEAAVSAEWEGRELAKGRDPRELTWDNCVHERGLWKDAEVEGGEDL